MKDVVEMAREILLMLEAVNPNDHLLALAQFLENDRQVVVSNKKK